jgi:hypothetical protein
MSINQDGTVAGYYIDDKNLEHGFIRSTSGEYATFDIPGMVETKSR